MSGENGQRRLTKLDQKRMQIYQQRRDRLISAGVPPEQVDEKIEDEDYARLPTETKLRRMDTAFGSAIRQLSKEMQDLKHNDVILADALDVNFRSIAKMMDKLGISREEQQKFLAEAKEDMARELEARQRAADQAQREGHAPAELEESVTQAGEPLPPPDGATVFEG